MAYNGSGSNSPGAKDYDDAHRLQDLGHPNNTSVSFARPDAMNPRFFFFFLSFFYRVCELRLCLRLFSTKKKPQGDCYPASKALSPGPSMTPISVA